MENNKLTEFNPEFPQKTSAYIANNEINLIDLTLILLRRKFLISIIFLLCLTLGFTAALLLPRTYTYSTSIEIGSQIIDGKILQFGSPETLSAKIKHSFIPLVLNEYQKSQPENTSLPKITVTTPKKSAIIILESKGAEDKGETISELLNSVSQKIQEDHARIYNSLKNSLQSGLDNALKLQSESSNLISNDTNFINIESYKTQIANLRETRAILPPMQSNQHTGTSRKLIVIASAMLGLFLAVFAAFGAEFWSKLKQVERKAK